MRGAGDFYFSLFASLALLCCAVLRSLRLACKQGGDREVMAKSGCGAVGKYM